MVLPHKSVFMVLMTTVVLSIVIASHADFVTAKIPVKTSPYAVAVNPVTNRIYTANYGSGNVTMINRSGSGPDSATISAGNGPRFLGINAVTNKIYAANFLASTVTVIDGATNQTKTINVMSNPVAIAVHASTNMIYVANYGGATVTAINGVTDETATIAVGSGPAALCVNTVTNRIYVANSGSNDVTVINGATNETSTVEAGTSPSSIAANTVTNKIYVANSGSNTVTIIDGETNQTTAVATGAGPGSVAVDHVANKIYVANADANSMTVINGTDNATATVAVGANPVALSVNTVTGKAYITNYESNDLAVFVADSSRVKFLSTGTGPMAVAINTITNRVYVANSGANGVTEVDGMKMRISVVELNDTCTGIVINPITDQVYLSHGPANKITVLNGAKNAAEGTINVSNLGKVVLNPVTDKVYAISGTGVAVIDGKTGSSNRISIGDRSIDHIAINRITDKIYAVDSTAIISVIDGKTSGVSQINAGNYSNLRGIYINPLLNSVLIMVDTTDRSGVLTINTITQTVSLASQFFLVSRNEGYYLKPYGVTVDEKRAQTYIQWAGGTGGSAAEVNPATGVLYRAMGDSLTVNTAGLPSPRIGFHAGMLASNPVNNKMYALGYDGELAIIDGSTNAFDTMRIGSNTRSLAVNPVSGKLYITIENGKKLVVIDESLESEIKQIITINNSNTTTAARPQFSGGAKNLLSLGRSGVYSILTSINIDQGSWGNGNISGRYGSDSVAWTWHWGTDSLPYGESYLLAAVLDSQAGTTNNHGSGTIVSGNNFVFPVYRYGLPPDPPDLVSPEDNAVNQSLNLLMTWKKSAGATYYVNQIATDSLFQNIVGMTYMHKDTAQNGSYLKNGMTYYWRVKAVNPPFASDPSEVRRFTTTPDTPPPAPAPIAPSNGEISLSTNSAFQWSNSVRATSYTLQIATDSVFTAIVRYDSSITDTTHTVSGLSTITLYYWRVRAKNSGGSSAWSQTRNFMTGTTGAVTLDAQVPKEFQAHFSSNVLRYTIPEPCRVRITMFDLRGRLHALVLNRMQGPGYYSLPLGRKPLPRGTYCVVFEAGSFIKRHTVVMVSK